jgi:hypothetical protein
MPGKFILWLSAFVFIAYGLVGIAAPAIPAGFAGLVMGSGDAYAEISSMYGGLQTGLGAFCLLAATRADYYRAGLALLALGIGAVGVTRLLAALITVEPVTAYTWGASAYEITTAVIAALAWQAAVLALKNSNQAG